MKFFFVVIGKTRGWSAQATEEFVDKIQPFVPFELVCLPGDRRSRLDHRLKVEKESEQILRFLSTSSSHSAQASSQLIPPTVHCVLFDEGGRSMDSLRWSQELNRILLASSGASKKTCVFVVGGAFGVTQQIKDLAHQKISLSPFVLNHQVAQIVALEQIYRGFMILHNRPYHNA